jgi:uncharacterized protein DUF5990
MEQEVRLRIIVEKPPVGVDYALQKGRGSAYETVQTQRSDGRDLSFEFIVGVKPGRGKTPSLAGPFVQGPPDGRFIYLDIGTAAGQVHSCWTRRLKVPLQGITSEVIATPAVLEARVPGTGKDDGPTCATVKPFSGWHPRA